MECEQCGLIPELSSCDGKCPFCGAQYPIPAEYVPVSPIPTPERARELRDICTDVMALLVRHPLSKSGDDSWLDLETKIYHWCKEDAERFDELVNRES